MLLMWLMLCLVIVGAGNVPAQRCLIPDCKACYDDGRCSECKNNKYLYLSPLNGICVTNCPRGYFKHIGSGGDRTCQPCTGTESGIVPSVTGIPNCRECNAQSSNTLQCLVCDNGYRLSAERCLVHCSDLSGYCSECETIIGTERYCSRCTSASGVYRAPINGICIHVAMDDESGCAVSDGTCTSCGAGYFLHNGGCYNGALSLGKTICTRLGYGTANGGTNYGEGKCNSCEDGYRDSSGACELCIRANCKRCFRGSNTCQICTEESMMVGVQRIRECLVFPNAACSDKHCAQCTENAAVCEVCEGSYFLTPIGTCTSNCSLIVGYFANPHRRICEQCKVKDCAVCATSNSCDICIIGYALENGLCKECPKDCYSCTSINRCIACNSNFILESDGSCVSEKTYTGTCRNANVLQIKYVTGIGKDNYEETATLKAYLCSQCESGYVPINGKCVSVTSVRPNICQVNANAIGTCRSCSGNYFYKNGGCYEAGGSQGAVFCRDDVANNGRCDSCATGYYMDNEEGCTACTESCKECSTSNQCKTCIDGYALSGNACIQCDKSCLKCAGSGSTKCTECRPGYYRAAIGPVLGGCYSCGNEDEHEGWSGTSGCTQCVSNRIPGKVTCLSTSHLLSSASNRMSRGKIVALIIAALLIGASIGALTWWFVRKSKAKRRANISLLNESIDRTSNIASPAAPSYSCGYP